MLVNVDGLRALIWVLVAECDDAPNLIDYVPCEGVPCPHWPPPCPPTCDEEDGPDDYPFR